jgi:hypothetical protein
MTAYEELKAKGYTDDQIKDLMQAYPGSSQPAAQPLSLAYAKELQARTAKDIGTSAAISGGLQALQLGLQAVPTAQDVRNRQKLADLKRLEEQGKMGLTGKERTQLEQELLAPVAAQARETRMRQEAIQASAGGTSAADVVRAQREATRTTAAAAQQAGMAISRMNLDRAAQQLRELEERTAYKAERQKGLLQAGAQAVGGMGAVAGQVRAAQAVKGIDVDKLATESGMSPEEIVLLLNMARRGQTTGARGDMLAGLISQSGV